MILATQEPDLLDWLIAVLQMKKDVVAQGLWVGLALSTIYLLVMLLTRWGDRHTLFKALVFSGLIHVVSMVGWVAVVPAPIRSAELDRPEKIEPTPLELEVLSDDPQEIPEDGNTPVWNKLPDSVEPQLARVEPENFEPVPYDNPDREKPASPEKTAPEIPDLPPERPEETEQVPEPNPTEQEPAPRMPVEVPVEGPEAIAVPNVEAPPKLRERNPVPERGPMETTVDRQPSRGATDQVEREVDPNRELASIERPDDPEAYVRRGPEAEVMEQRTSPAPANAPTPEFGDPDNTGEEETPAGERTPRRPTRLVDREPLNRINPNVERTRTERTPEREQPERRRDFVPTPAETASDLLANRTVPEPVRPRLETPRTGRRIALPATYRYRGPEQRRKAALKFGGSEASERAVEEALRWLAANQTDDGSWDASAHGAGQVKLTKDGLDTRGAEVRGGIPGVNADSGVTALAILAFLGAGYTHEEGPYAEHVDSALTWLISQQGEDGYLGGKATYYARAYCHGMATYALAEAYGMRSDPTLESPLREPLEKAIEYILDHQHVSDGGWRYRKGETGDMSIFGWNLMALKSAEIAGLKIPDANRNLLVKFLTDRSLGRNKGLAGYHPEYGAQGASPTMTAEALFSKQMLGLQRSNPASKEAMDYLMTHLPHREELNFYYWYYGTLATFQYGGEPWKEWNESLRDLLIAEQRANGPNRGSWDPKDRWGGYGGRVYSTALSALILEVYYRFLPLYQMGGRYDEE